MNYPLRIAHLSDLHLSSVHPRKNLVRSARILEGVHRIGIDHLIVTGDLTEDATPGDLAVARGLFEGHGLLDPSRATVVIGNHDVFGGIRSGEGIVAFPGRCRTTPYADRVRAFGSAFAELHHGAYFPIPGELYPFSKEVGGVTLVGVNSVAPHSPLVNPVGSNGAVAPGQLDAARGLIRSARRRGRFVLLLIHHHFERTEYDGIEPLGSVWGSVGRQTMRLWEKGKMMRAFASEGVDFVLHGHVHETRAYDRLEVRYLNAGATLMDDGRLGTGFFLLEIGEEGVVVERLRVFDDGTIGRPKPSRGEGVSSRFRADAVPGLQHQNGPLGYGHPHKPRRSETRPPFSQILRTLDGPK